jgi:DNA (cytosine-5)-methyltransferase 1
MNTAKITKIQLISKCKELGITRYSSKNKAELIVLIDEYTKKEHIKQEPIKQKYPKEENKSITSKLNVIDLFCGCGGMSKGLTDAGLNIIAGIDVWDKAVESYNENFTHKAYCEDLTLLSPEKFNELYNKDNTQIDIIVGGPPCQSFSIAGRRDKNDPRNALFMDYVKYLNYFKPKAFIMENVIGMLSKKTLDGENVIDIIMEQLSQNYNCIINKLYASDFEVPQNRRRVIIIGVRKDLNIIPQEPEVIIKDVKNRIPVKNVLLSKEEVEASTFLSEKAIQGILNKKEKSKEKGAGFGAQFLNLDKPSYTIPARYWKDGYDALVKYNEKEMRRLTILELKRIQSFPDDYIIKGNKKDIIMQIGNAVACKFAYHLGKYMINMLTENLDIIVDKFNDFHINDISHSNDKTYIINMFNTNVKGKPIIVDDYNKKHCGKEGYWLEKQMGIVHNSKNEPDINGYEMKKNSNKITLGDFSATEYAFSNKRQFINAYNKWNDDIQINRTEFIKYFGNPNVSKNNRYSWSGSCIPTYNKWNNNGQILLVQNNDIIILYSFSKDTRDIKNTYPIYLRNDNILIAVWNEYKMKTNIDNKFNKKGFFICKKIDDTYQNICFGKPFDFEYFIK